MTFIYSLTSRGTTYIGWDSLMTMQRFAFPEIVLRVYISSEMLYIIKSRNQFLNAENFYRNNNFICPENGWLNQNKW